MACRMVLMYSRFSTQPTRFSHKQRLPCAMHGVYVSPTHCHIMRQPPWPWPRMPVHLAACVTGMPHDLSCAAGKGAVARGSSRPACGR